MLELILFDICSFKVVRVSFDQICKCLLEIILLLGQVSPQNGFELHLFFCEQLPDLIPMILGKLDFILNKWGNVVLLDFNSQLAEQFLQDIYIRYAAYIFVINIEIRQLA